VVALAGSTLVLAGGAPALAAGSGARAAKSLTGSPGVVSAASAKWKIQKTPNPGSFANELYGVSCTASNDCVAVGIFAPDASLQSTAEVWNGRKWAVQATPNPASTANSQLNAVSCTAANDCVAVGSYTIGSTALTLAEVWNGTAWATMPTPNASGATNSELNAVSCTAANACVAVGTYGISAHPYLALAEVWNGASWTIQSTPDPGPANELEGVSCTAANACTAVGFGGSASALVEDWNGSTWSLVSTPPTSSGSLSQLLGVSCTAANACVAAGSYELGADQYLTLAEAWNGSVWSIQATPSPTVNSYLDDVSCTGSNACVAVGYDYNTGSPEVPLSEVWNGVTWTSKSMPDGAGVLDGTSCAVAGTCIAVGAASNGLALSEAWNGTKWAIEPTSDPSVDSDLNAVSCTATNTCVAVGYDYDYYAVTLAEVWNGTTWAIQTTPNPTGATTSDLLGVSCTAANACVAVGIYWNGSAYQTLAEMWNGTSWTIVATPDPSATDSELIGVSCTAANACVAVGLYSSSSGAILTLAEVWNGTSWSVQTTPNPSGATLSALSEVSCTAANACVAVGYGFTSSGVTLTLAEVWNGTTWAIQTTPNPSGATTSEFSGVSCTAANACVSVGFDEGGSGDEVTLAEVWNGTIWAIKPTPNPSGATTSELIGVSCTAANACASTGYDQGTGDQLTLAEVWNGTKWAIRPTPIPAGAIYSALKGVSCTAATCIAAGVYDNIAGDSLTLAEAEG
jgi:hypothetical protein